MTKTVRLILLASVCALALAFGGNALAAYNPSLLTAGTSHGLGSRGPVVVGVGQGQTDDATGVITLYAPRGYGVALTQAPGTKIGDLDAIFRVGTTPVQIEGTVTARDPGAYANQLQFPCGEGVRHEAVWLIESTLNNTGSKSPCSSTGPSAPRRSSRRPRSRSASPRPTSRRRRPRLPGASLIVAAFSVSGVFSNPNTRATYPWNALFIPYAPGTATLNPTNAAQSTSYTRLPVQLAVNAKKVRQGKRKYARVTTCLSEGGQAVRGVRVTSSPAGLHAGRAAWHSAERTRAAA